MALLRRSAVSVPATLWQSSRGDLAVAVAVAGAILFLLFLYLYLYKYL